MKRGSSNERTTTLDALECLSSVLVVEGSASLEVEKQAAKVPPGLKHVLMVTFPPPKLENAPFHIGAIRAKSMRELEVVVVHDEVMAKIPFAIGAFYPLTDGTRNKDLFVHHHPLRACGSRIYSESYRTKS